MATLLHLLEPVHGWPSVAELPMGALVLASRVGLVAFSGLGVHEWRRWRVRRVAP